MKRTILTLILSFFPVMAAFSTGDYPLDKVETNHTDKASLQRGLKYYQNYCSGCHSTRFQRYERVADDLGIPHDLMMDNLVFTKGTKIGDLMTNKMDPKDAKEWFGIAPPDLTLVTRVRGEDWLYTFLRTFYEDPTRPWGVNNKVFPDVAMPYILTELQGVQIDTCEGTDDPGETDPLTGEKLCGLKVDPERKGSMTPTEFDQVIYDLVNFLSYSAEPMKMERQRLGLYVFLFLLVFLIFAYFLKREYWKDIH
ncbi:MAG: cytochrome c1 [Candidatus Endonucleobacter sp. (ex Gigantidas childressi)]|nr:cytochrome c1 [Candidatus Endonucleobacter sp. (ex Gigantidas childressi)]